MTEENLIEINNEYLINKIINIEKHIYNIERQIKTLNEYTRTVEEEEFIEGVREDDL